MTCPGGKEQPLDHQNGGESAVSTGSGAPRLWTRDFTILTLGSMVSLLGNAISGFSMSLLVLDYTQSPFLYAIYIAVYTLPQVVMPVFSGALLDRFSRRRMIYTLDFISAALYAVAAFVLGKGWFSFPLLAFYCFLIGSINSIYTVAYQSFYPLLISEGNYSKAYSISSVLETLAVLMVPVATFAYNQVGIAPLLGVNAVLFAIAATVETQIRADEKYIETQRQALEEAGKPSRHLLLSDIRDGFVYLRSEPGLTAIVIYFAISSFANGAATVITLPYFKSTFQNGEYIFMLVWGMALVGRAVGGAFHYRKKIPTNRKFTIALAVYVAIALLEGSYFYFTIPVMMAMMFCTGLMGVTSYTIRISATQSYVPDEKKGRFNGAFNMLNTVGSFLGELSAGALTKLIPQRAVVSSYMGLLIVAAMAIIGGRRRHVAPIYNTHQ